MENIFKQLAFQYTQERTKVTSLWNVIKKNYGATNRHYHNLLHIENMYAQLIEAKTIIIDWDTMLFSLFYHDIIYKATKNNNEEKSANYAVKVLNELQYPFEKIVQCNLQILATKGHHMSSNNNTNLFIDADLSILGHDWEIYKTYFTNVRKEYIMYPNFMYNAGRKKVLHHFLAMESIFKTSHFKHRFENRAKENMLKELDTL